MPTGSKELLFTLKDVDGKALISIHFAEVEKDEIVETVVPTELTVTELLHDRKKGTYYFYDSTKTKTKYWLNMFDSDSRKAVPLYTTKSCWWCKAGFTTHPIGCPISYEANASGEKKKMFDEYLASMNITSTNSSDYFVTEGVFCSFPCLKAYIIDNCSRNFGGRYKESCTYLTLMYFKLYGEMSQIPRAGSWKMIKEWGGPLTIDEFRQTYGKLLYTETPNVRRPMMYCSSTYIKESRL